MTVSEVAEKFGIPRQSLYRWMARYEEGGLEALQDRSHRPRRVPHQMRVDVEVRALELRRRHMAWGPIRLRHELLKEFAPDRVPSQMAIYRALLRHGLVEPRPSRKRLRDYKRWEPGVPMELWQLDVVGGFLLDDGTDCKALTGLDDHSRFCVSAQLMVRATARPVCEAFGLALRRHGVPEEVLTDIEDGRALRSPCSPAGRGRLGVSGACPLPVLTERSARRVRLLACCSRGVQGQRRGSHALLRTR